MSGLVAFNVDTSLRILTAASEAADARPDPVRDMTEMTPLAVRRNPRRDSLMSCSLELGPPSLHRSLDFDVSLSSSRAASACPVIDLNFTHSMTCQRRPDQVRRTEDRSMTRLTPV